MQTTPKSYTDIDYESFPIADLTLDRHWIQLPTAVLLERQKTRRLAQHQERLAALPEDHKIILVPADPTYSPLEEELWPLINGIIHQTLQPHPEVFAKVVAAVDRALETHRGWRNPYPANSTPHPRQLEKIINSRNEPGDLVQDNHSSSYGNPCERSKIGWYLSARINAASSSQSEAAKAVRTPLAPA